jgi:hypothetical protein
VSIANAGLWDHDKRRHRRRLFGAKGRREPKDVLGLREAGQRERPPAGCAIASLSNDCPPRFTSSALTRELAPALGPGEPNEQAIGAAEPPIEHPRWLCPTAPEYGQNLKTTPAVPSACQTTSARKPTRHVPEKDEHANNPTSASTNVV